MIRIPEIQQIKKISWGFGILKCQQIEFDTIWSLFQEEFNSLSDEERHTVILDKTWPNTSSTVTSTSKNLGANNNTAIMEFLAQGHIKTDSFYAIYGLSTLTPRTSLLVMNLSNAKFKEAGIRKLSEMLENSQNNLKFYPYTFRLFNFIDADGSRIHGEEISWQGPRRSIDQDCKRFQLLLKNAANPLDIDSPFVAVSFQETGIGYFERYEFFIALDNADALVLRE